jgi:hypothetical protein
MENKIDNKRNRNDGSKKVKKKERNRKRETKE